MSEHFHLTDKTIDTTQEKSLDSIRIQAKHLVTFLEGKGFGQPVKNALQRGIDVAFSDGIIGKNYWDIHKRELRISRSLHRAGKNVSARSKRHELSHAFSKNETRKTESKYTQKSGFSYYHNKKIDENRNESVTFFWGLNEGMTELVALESVPGSASAWERFLTNTSSLLYRNEVRLLKTIISQMSISSGASEERIFNLFLESYLQGWKPELKRLLLQIYGKNALRILAVLSIPQWSKHDPTVRNHWDDVFTFFSLESSGEQRALAARQILENTSIKFLE